MILPSDPPVLEPIPAPVPPTVSAQPSQPPFNPDTASDATPSPTPNPADEAILADSRRRTRRSFLVAGVAATAGYALVHNIDWPSDEAHDDLLRKSFNFNAAVSRAIFRDAELAPTYPLDRAQNLRVNGVYGLSKDLPTANWRLQLVGVRDAAHAPRFVPDVTAWVYQYTGVNGGDKGHDTKHDTTQDTKLDPRKQTTPSSSNGSKDPGSGPSSNPADAEGKQDGTSAQKSSAKMAPGPVAAQAQQTEGGDDDDSNAPDANHTGRRSRGNGEAGESDSTLLPNTPGLLLTLEDVTGKLPRHELVTQFKCIEGWSQIVHWAGVRMADFLDLYPPALINGKEPRFVYMETPDGDYYTGYDLHVMRHTQTLLVTEMMGAPLTQNHGAPLRLHMPTKYGYKQIKRIGLIAYTNKRPDDYWSKLGYDWYASL